MDNIGELLIFILFIIISIINSIAKKKKAGKTQEKKPSPAEQSKMRKTGTILDDLLDIKDEKAEPVYYGDEDSRENNADKTWDPEKEFKENDYETATNLDKQERYNERMRDIWKRSSIGDTIPIPERPASVKKYINKNKFAKLIHDPVNLKEYILISEILRKPKALRR